jgi:hypothetical protein
VLERLNEHLLQIRNYTGLLVMTRILKLKGKWHDRMDFS